MYCLSCGNSLPEEALFCEKCGKLTIKGMSERESESTTVASASSPSDPYYSRPSISYGTLAPSGGTQNPYAPANPYEPLAPPPPPRRRTSPGFLKGLLSGMIVILLLSGGLGGWLLLRQGTLFPLTPHTQGPKATPSLPPTPTSVPQTVNISTQIPLSDGRVEAWQSTVHAHVIVSMLTAKWFIPLFGEKVRILEETATLQPEEFCWRWQGNARTSTVSVTRGARTHVGQRRD
jgi:hypothetical protein